ncbi:sulfite exporter TauE/SafE family protein [Lactovum miscens]|uniref:Probable membrane transporter protein n=1 Tax=Lactovum miscens TaxID=190387 RepID=A0A841C681_9LACT|nr:hypothetical protein [Lactovum miscens]
MLTITLLLIGGILAGILASVTGMASLVSYPILLATGLSPIVANVTNTAGLIFSGLGSSISSRRELKFSFKDLIWILPTAIFGSLSGCILLLTFPNKVFEKVVPFMILGAAIFFVFQPLLKKASTGNAQEVRVKKSLFNLIAIFLIGTYGGYFGAASGVFMLLVFSLTEGMSLLAANALKNVTMGITNLVATIVFIFFGHINWLFGLTMGAGFMIGGYIGPAIARKLPKTFLRWLIIIGAFILAGYMFKIAYL